MFLKAVGTLRVGRAVAEQLNNKTLPSPSHVSLPLPLRGCEGRGHPLLDAVGGGGSAAGAVQELQLIHCVWHGIVTGLRQQEGEQRAHSSTRPEEH